MSNKQTPFAQAAIRWNESCRPRKAREMTVSGVFLMLTCLAIFLATPAPLRATFAELLSGFLSGPAQVWHGETVALTLAPVLAPAQRDR
jgi:hypothetical protein